MSSKKLWLIKSKNGRIQGPLSSDDIIKLIKEKTIEGEETIAEYPGGKWKPVSVEPQFYEQLLQVLSQVDGQDGNTVSSASAPSVGRSSRKSSSFPESVSRSSATVMIDVNELKSLRKYKEKQRKKDSFRVKKKTKSSVEKTVLYHPEEESYDLLEPEEILSEEGVSENQPPSFRKKRLIFLLGVLGILVFFFFQYETEQKSVQEYVTLAVAKKRQPSISPQQKDLLIKQGLLNYLRGTVSSYGKAQTLFVSAIEGDPKDTYTMAMLCLVYLELWPFTRQDLKATNAVSLLINRAGLLNKGGVRSGLCHSVGLLIKGKYEDAKTMVESSLDGLSGSVKDVESQKLVPLFYYLKARVLYYLNDYANMISYLNTVQTILPKWSAPYMIMGDVLVKQNKPARALAIYKKVLSLEPGHKEVKLKIGLMEYKYFHKTAKAESTLKTALSDPEIVSYRTLSEAYFALAEISMKKKDMGKTLEYARRAYSYNPANKTIRNLIIQIGGVETLKQTQVRSHQLIYEADQLVLDNKFRQAIGYYEEAFEVDRGQNAMVAVKVAKSYWALSFSAQALSWLKKAININPVMMEAYVLMSEYYSEKYDFHNANRILEIAFRKVPRSYELYRGKAYVSMKREDYNKAIRYAKMALKIYEADMESYVILSEAYGKTGDVDEALAFATRGLEVDPNATKTQIAYAKALGNVYGVDTGVNYFQKLVENYPLAIKYRMELVKYLFTDEQYGRAQSALLKIIDIEPKYNEAYFYLGRIFMFNGDFKSAYEAFLKSAIINPSDPLPTFYIGQLRLKEKRYPEAKRHFEKALALNKLYPKAHYYLGRIAFLKGDYETAINQARLESRSNPKLITPYLLAGESYEKMGKFLDCAVEYQKAVELNPDNMNFYVKTARCYRGSGHLDLAVKILKKAKGEDGDTKSGDPLLYKEFGIIYEIRGDYQEATGSYCNYLNLMPRAPDRRDIEKRMKKLSKLTGKTEENCG